MPRSKGSKGRHPREGKCHTPRRQASEKSDEPIVPKKSRNPVVTPGASMEGRGEANGNPASRNVPRTQGRISTTTSLMQVGEVAKRRKGERFNNLMCHLKVPLLREAYLRLRKNAAPGIDGQTWREYATALDERLVDLQDRIHRGSYHPQPVRRVHIPKGGGRTRPLGIPVLEDKIVQQAVRMVLEPIYESMFMGFVRVQARALSASRSGCASRGYQATNQLGARR